MWELCYFGANMLSQIDLGPWKVRWCSLFLRGLQDGRIQELQERAGVDEIVLGGVDKVVRAVGKAGMSDGSRCDVRGHKLAPQVQLATLG